MDKLRELAQDGYVVCVSQNVNDDYIVTVWRNEVNIHTAVNVSLVEAIREAWKYTPERV